MMSMTSGVGAGVASASPRKFLGAKFVKFRQNQNLAYPKHIRSPTANSMTMFSPNQNLFNFVEVKKVQVKYISIITSNLMSKSFNFDIGYIRTKLDGF